MFSTAKRFSRLKECGPAADPAGVRFDYLSAPIGRRAIIDINFSWAFSSGEGNFLLRSVSPFPHSGSGASQPRVCVLKLSCANLLNGQRSAGALN